MDSYIVQMLLYIPENWADVNSWVYTVDLLRLGKFGLSDFVSSKSIESHWTECPAMPHQISFCISLWLGPTLGGSSGEQQLSSLRLLLLLMMMTMTIIFYVLMCAVQTLLFLFEYDFTKWVFVDTLSIFVAGRRLEQIFLHSLLVFSKNSTPPPTTAGKKKSVKCPFLGDRRNVSLDVSEGRPASWKVDLLVCTRFIIACWWHEQVNTWYGLLYSLTLSVY